MTESPPRRRVVSTRAAAAVAIVLCALAALFTLFAVLLDSEAVTRRVVERVLPRASESLGREIRLESAHAKLLPRPEVTLRKLTIAGRKGEPPLLEAPVVAVELALWPLLRSFGKEVRVDAVRVEAPEINLVRNREGVWNFEGLGQDEPSEREVTIARASMEDARVNVIDRSSAHGEATVALTQLDVKYRTPAPEGPIQLQLNAAFASEAQNLSMDLKVDASGAYPEVEGFVALTRAQLTRLEGVLPARLGTVLMGGHLDLDGRVVTAADGAWEVDAQARLDAVRVRGEPASGGMDVRARIDPANPKTARIEMERLALKGPGVELGGSGTMTFEPPALDFALQGPLLDLDVLLSVLPKEEVEAPPVRTSMLPASTRRALDEVQARGTLRVDRVVRGGLELTNLDAKAELRRGVLTLPRAQAELYDGKVDASGTTANLLLAHPGWNLKARLEEVDLGKLAQAVEARAPLTGRLDGALELKGEGAEWTYVRDHVTGTGVLSVTQGALQSVELGERLAQVAGAALRRVGKEGAAESVERAGSGTPLRDLALSFRVENGRMTLREPLVFSSGFGGARLEGSIGLDTTLDLRGDAVLSAGFLEKRAGVKPPGPLEVPMTVTGTLGDPDVGLPSPAELATRLAAPAARAGAKRVEEEVRKQARRRVGDVLRRLGRGD